jgi:hypothetical protein
MVSAVACTHAQTPAHEPPHAPPAPERALDRVVIVTVDGLRPEDVLRMPTLSKLAREGAFAAPPEGARSVTPTVTYPAHTSIATGTHPDKHGITTNQAPDKDRRNLNGWRWYAEDIRAETLWGVAYDAGLRTALVTWPVTVGARATFRMPEYWRANTPDDLKLVRALSTEGSYELVRKEHADFDARYQPPNVKDSANVDAALTALAHARPHLMLVHIWETDNAQHAEGPDSARAHAALENADRELTRLVDALRAAPEWPRTVLFVVSDHGFARTERGVLVNVHLANANLGDKLWAITAGGFAYLYLRDASHADSVPKARAYFEELEQDPAHGIARVLGREEIALFHGDPEAVLGLEAIPGFALTTRENETKPLVPYGGGTHGYLPDRLEMRATLIVYGPRVPTSPLEGARLIDIAPTAARWLGLELKNADGRVLPVTLK